MQEDVIKRIQSKIFMNNEYLKNMFGSLSFEKNFTDTYSHYEEQNGKVLQWIMDVDQLNINIQDLKEATESSFEQMASALKLKVKEKDVCSELSLEEDRIYITGRRLIIEADNITVNNNGLKAEGTIYATAGDIGGWKIEGSSLKGQTLSDGNISTISGGTITADSGITSYVDVDVLDFNPNYDDVIHTVDLSYATISTTHDTENDTAFGDITVLGDVELTGESSLECEDLECTTLIAGKGGKYVTIFCEEIITDEESWSDERLKKDIEEIDTDEAVKFILALEPKKYEYKRKNRRSTGFIAQDIKKIAAGYPTMVTEAKGYYGLCYRQIIPLMVGAIKDNIRKLEETA